MSLGYPHALWEPINFRHLCATTALKTEHASCQTYLTPTCIFFHCLLPIFSDSAAHWIHNSATCTHLCVGNNVGEGKERNSTQSALVLWLEGGSETLLAWQAACRTAAVRIRLSPHLNDYSEVALNTQTLTHTHSLRSCLFLCSLI